MRRRIAAALAAVLLVSLLGGCTPGQKKGAEAPELFSRITGIEPDQTVVTVGDTPVSAQLYFYWVCYVCSSLEYSILNDYESYGMYGSCVDTDTMTVNWDSTYNGMPLMDYAVAQAEETMKYCLAIEALAREAGAELTQQDQKTMQEQFRQSVQQMGGEESFRTYLKMLGISRETFDRVNAFAFLYDKLLALVLEPGSSLYLEPEAYNRYAAYADHILLANQDMRTGELLTPEKSAQKYLQAEELLAQLRSAEDPQALFDQLAGEYSEDPGRQNNPTGYVYTPGSMVPEFEQAVAGLQPGQISEVVQSDYGFHIILRRDLLPVLESSPEKKAAVAGEYLDELLADRQKDAEVHYDPCLKDMDWIGFYAAYLKEVDALAG